METTKTDNDEAIYPVDFRQVGHIVDTQIHSIMVRPLNPGVRLTALFDSCRSGEALDLPYVYSTRGILKKPILAKEAGQDLLNFILSYSQGGLNGVAPTSMGFIKKATRRDDAYNKSLATKTSPADVIMWSISKEDRMSLVYLSRPPLPGSQPSSPAFKTLLTNYRTVLKLPAPYPGLLSRLLRRTRSKVLPSY